MICTKEQYYSSKPTDKTFVKIIFDNNYHGIVLNTMDWRKCKEYAEENKVKIKEVSIRIRSNFENINIDNCEGVFFKTGSVAQLGACFNSFNTFLLGVKDKNIIKIKKYRIPEIIMYSEEDREVNDDDSELIISNL
jgi:hypothetical protein